METSIHNGGLYKYVFHDEIIYIGMSKDDISRRIKEHASESKFVPYLKECKIFFAPFTRNNHLIKAYETLLIDEYCPILNVSEKPVIRSGERFDSILPALKWYEYNEEYNEERSAPNPLKKQQRTWRRKIKECCEDAGTYRRFSDDEINSLSYIMVFLGLSESLIVDCDEGTKRNEFLKLKMELVAEALRRWQRLGLTQKDFWKAIETL